MDSKITFKIVEQGWTNVYFGSTIIGSLLYEYQSAINSGAVGYVPGGYEWVFYGECIADDNIDGLLRTICAGFYSTKRKKEAQQWIVERTERYFA